MSEVSPGTLEMLNTHLGGFNKAMGVKFTQATLDEVQAEMAVTDNHLQPYGLVHGGVLCALIESVCSAGAAVNVFPQGKSTVGLENNTSFLRAARQGMLVCTARPLSKGRKSHVWRGEIHDEQERLIASGRVRMLVLDPGATAAGEEIAVKTPHP